MIELAQSVAEGHLDLEELAALPDDEAVKRLCELRGVGRWTAEYVLLRGLGRTHIFPGDDVGARNNLRAGCVWPSRSITGGPACSAPLGRYAGLVYFHLLLDRLAEAGYLGETIALSRARPLQGVILGAEAPSRFVLDEAGNRMAEIRLKRAYESPLLKTACGSWWNGYGRGLSKEHAAVELWMKDVAPSPEFRRGLTMIRPGGGNSKNATMRSSGRRKTWLMNSAEVPRQDRHLRLCRA